MFAGLLLSSLLLFQAAPDSYQQSLQRGQAALQAGELEAAEAAFQQARNLQPARAAVYYSLGEVLSRRERPGEAIANFRRAIELAPHDPQPYLRLAALEAQLKRFHDAEQVLRLLLRLRPRSAEAYLLLGRIAKEQEDNALAEKHLRRYVNLRPRDPVGLGELGIVLLTDEKSREGEALLKRALAIDPGLGLVHYNLGLLYVLRGENEKGRSYLESAVRLLPANADAQYQMGIVLVRLNEPEKAEAFFRKAIELSPEHLEARYALGTLLGRLARPQEAAEVLADHERRSAAALEKRQRDRRVSAYHMEVKNLLEENQTEAADGKLTEILAIDSQNDLAHYRKGQIAFLRQDYASALAEARSAINAKSFEPAYHLLEGMCLERMQQDEPATEAYGRVLNLADYSDAHAALARLALRRNDAAQAVEHMRRAVALEPKDADLRLTLAEVLAMAGDEAGSRRERARAQALRNPSPQPQR